MKLVKWIGIILGSLIVLLLLVGVAINFIAARRLNQSYDVQPEPITIPADPEAVERGKHLVLALSSCTSCHGDNLEGEVFVDDPPIGLVPAPNLTAGEGGVGNNYTDKDWIRAIRHGIGADGKPLVFMPSQHYHHLSDEDLGAMIAYLKSMPPVDHKTPEKEIDLPGRLILGLLDSPPAATINHQNQPPPAPESGVTEAYGEYLVTVGVCKECHGTNLAGRVETDGPPPGPNLTPGGDLANWTEEEFIKAMRNGVTPDGDTLDPELMPWPNYGNLTDEELKAIWLYLKSLPARTVGESGT